MARESVSSRVFAIRFSVLHTLMGFVVVSFVIATLAFSGGYLIYPPLLVLSVFGVLAARQAMKTFSTPKCSRARAYWMLALYTTLFAVAAALYLPFGGYAMRSFANKRTIQLYRNQILEMDDPELVRLAGRELLSKLMIEERITPADLQDLPRDIARLNPSAIYARGDMLSILLYRNYEKSLGILIFSESSIAQRGDEQIIDGLWLWESK